MKPSKDQKDKFLEYMSVLDAADMLDNPQALALLACSLMVVVDQSNDLSPRMVAEMLLNIEEDHQGISNASISNLKKISRTEYAYRRDNMTSGKLTIKRTTDGGKPDIRTINTTTSEIQKWLEGGDIDECLPRASQEDKAWLMAEQPTQVVH